MRRETWLDVRERGSSWALWFLLRLLGFAGRPGARAFLAALALYYTAASPALRASSRQYLLRIGQRARFWDLYAHVLRFAQCTLDRVLLLQGRADLFDVRLFGHEHVLDLVDRGRGGILLGAHLGSFEAMRLAAATRRVPIHVVMNHSNAKRMATLIHAIDPAGALKIIEVGQGGLDFVFRLREVVERGELLAILADRVGPTDRSCTVTFLGAEAAFPTGPYFIAAALGCPVYLAFGLYRGRNRYDLYCEPFADRLELPRPREQSVVAQVERYAVALERYCRMAPDNWFNFFDFWASSTVPSAEEAKE